MSKNWHTLDILDVFTEVDSNENGLTTSQATARLEQFGLNKLPEQKPPSLAVIILRQFHSPLIYILAIAAVLAAVTGDLKDSGFIVAVLVINAVIGSYQEYRAEQSSRALQKLLSIHAIVLRDGEITEIAAENLVPGDIVMLESGNRVPADLRLSGSKGLEIDESLLTGESLAVIKDPNWQGQINSTLGDRRNMAYAGSMVIHGRSNAVVVDTGLNTAVGNIARDVAHADQGRPPLVDRMERFARRVGIVVVFAATLIGAIGVLLHGFGITEMLLFGIALAVSAIPEGLPVALTVALAVATRRMSKRGVIVRRLSAVEGLGSCTLIASDKTGTLTCNELTVKEVRTPDGEVFDFSGQGFEPIGDVLHNKQIIEILNFQALSELARSMVLCNEGVLHSIGDNWAWHGDPTDVALLSAGYKLGWQREASLATHPQFNSIPFEAEHRYSASYHRIDETAVALVKGAPERIADMCASQEHAMWLRQEAVNMAKLGYRVLAFAHGTAPDDLKDEDMPPEPALLRALGLVGMIDPPRPGVAEAIRISRVAGVRTIMVTGDHPVTAFAIAKNLGIAESQEQVITGTQLLDNTDLTGLLANTQVFSRVSPHQKLKIVQSARAAGEYVAVTGDGVNDAPALKAANIGVAMGKAGTDVAREAAELVITDDHYATITAGIEEGRIAYDNIRKVIYLLISTGAAEVVLVGLAVIAGMPLPLLPVQLLWLNLVTNGIQDVALAFEPGEDDVLKRKPRSPKESVFNRLMIERTLVAAIVMGTIGFFVFKYLLEAGWSESSARNLLLLLFVLFENFHILNSRSELHSAFAISLKKSPILVIGAITAFSIHLGMMHTAFGQTLLGTEAVSASNWFYLILTASSILIVMELHKVFWRAKTHKQEKTQN